MNLTMKELEKKLKLSRFQIMRLAKKHNWKVEKVKTGKVFSNTYFQEDIDKYLGKKVIKVEENKTTLTKYIKNPETVDELPNWNQEIAWARYIVCNKTAELMVLKRDKTKIEIFEDVVKDFKEMFPQQLLTIRKISRSTLHRWYLAYQKEPTNPMVLSTGYGAKKGRRTVKAEVLEDAKNIYFSPNKVSIMFVFERLVAKYGAECISYWTLRNFVKYDLNNIQKDRARLGPKEFKDKHTPYIERDYTTLAVNDLWVSDGHDMEIFCYHPFKKNNKGERLMISPKLMIWMDMRSRMITGFHVCFEENTEAIALALKDGIQKYGVPKEVYTDNGKAYKSKAFKGTDELLGIYAALGINARHAIPYNAQAKPIERWFLDFKETFAKSFITYKGGNILEKPEHLKHVMKDKTFKNQILEFEQVVEKVEDYIKYKNHLYYDFRRIATGKGHRGHGMEKRTPLEVMRSENVERIMLPDEKLRLLFLYEEIRTIGQNGITYLNNTYIHEQLYFLLGEKVKIKYDPQDLTFIYVYKVTGEFVCKADILTRASFTTVDGIKDHKRRVKKITKAEKEIVTTREEMREIEGIIEIEMAKIAEIENKKAKTTKKTVVIGPGLAVEID